MVAFCLCLAVAAHTVRNVFHYDISSGAADDADPGH